MKKRISGQAGTRPRFAAVGRGEAAAPPTRNREARARKRAKGDGLGEETGRARLRGASRGRHPSPATSKPAEGR